MPPKIVGIDLGTTFSSIAHVNDYGIPELIRNEDGKFLTPSVVFFDDDGFIVGEFAKQNAVTEPERVVEFVKREMGKPVTEFFREFGGKKYSAEEISAEILKFLKRDAEAALGIPIKDAVITVPAYFNDPERQATIRAGEIAGLRVHRIINEPTAAAIAYGKHQQGHDSTVFVFDLGGGTFDVTVMEISGDAIRIIATNGDHRLGGKDWDDVIIKYVAERFEIGHEVNPLESLNAYQQIQLKVVDAKIQLSTLTRANIITHYLGKSLRVELTRQQFEGMTAHLVERCRSFIDVVLHEANQTPQQIDTVLLVGGSTRMPMIRQMLTEYFGQPPDSSVNPDECVAIGAAIQGALIASERGGLQHPSTARTQGIMRISDVCSHSLGMVALDEIGELRNSIIIPKNTNIPIEMSRDDYVTTAHNQTELDVYVLQGESPEPRDCPVREVYQFYDIPPRPAQETRLKVTFKYNVNGLIEVEAVDIHSGKKLPYRKKEGEVDWDSLAAPAPMPMDIALVIDCSGSMSGSKLHDAKEAALRFVDSIGPNAHLGLISFGAPDAHIRSPLTQDFGSLRQAIERLSADGGTPMSEAIALAREKMFVNVNKTAACSTLQNTNIIVLLTDGMPNNREATRSQADITKQKGIRIIAIGVGDGVDSEYLKQVASSPEDYYFVKESFQLESTFATIATNLATELSVSKGGTHSSVTQTDQVKRSKRPDLKIGAHSSSPLK